MNELVRRSDLLSELEKIRGSKDVASSSIEPVIQVMLNVLESIVNAAPVASPTLSVPTVADLIDNVFSADEYVAIWKCDEYDADHDCPHYREIWCGICHELPMKLLQAPFLHIFGTSFHPDRSCINICIM